MDRRRDKTAAHGVRPVAILRRRAGIRPGAQAIEVRLVVNALLREGSIVKLDTGHESGQFYPLIGCGRLLDVVNKMFSRANVLNLIAQASPVFSCQSDDQKL
jgi:hypothetical protein